MHQELHVHTSRNGRVLELVHRSHLQVAGGIARTQETHMLGGFKVVATIPVTDLDRSKAFYGETLGLSMTDSNPFSARFQCGDGTELSIFKRAPSKADHTLAHFEIDDIEKTVSGLQGKGVIFLEYETPKTVNFIAEIGPARGAWMRDPDGNILGLRQAKK
jgi:catechol 2,3-dioxygenase-like lactoylglutathione lyase family enzyme